MSTTEHVTTDAEQLTALFARMCRAWTDGDADAYGACFTDDCDYVSFDGSRSHGRATVVRDHDTLFSGVLHGSSLVGEVESVRFLSDDVAVLHGTGAVLTAWRTTLPKGRDTRNTIVAVRTADGWRFSAIHNGRIRAMTIPAQDAFPSRANRALVRLARRLGIGHRAAAH